jgi:hypothetical protein
MPDLVPFQTTDPDQLFTLTINLVWQLLYSAEDADVAWVRPDLLVAIDALECGPWRTSNPHLKWSAFRLRFCAPCSTSR